MNNELINRAKAVEIEAFYELYKDIQKPLKSYLYRLVVDRSDAEDLAQDTFVKAFQKIDTFKNESSFKTWIFAIATNLARDAKRVQKRWKASAQDDGKAHAQGNPEVQGFMVETFKAAPYASYEINEHIDFCFTCLSKTLLIDQQVALILKDIYDFKVKEISLIIGRTEGVVKHLLHSARTSMTDIFDNRCAFVNKNGVCHQCTELQGLFNPKANQVQELINHPLYKKKMEGENPTNLYALRKKLIKHIDPLNSSGNNLQDALMRVTRQAIGEEIDLPEMK